MNKKVLMLCILDTILIVLITLLIILNNTILNKKYVISVMNKSECYVTVYNDIKKDINSYIMSSGLTSNVIDNMFTVKDIENNINNYINSIYNNTFFTTNSDEVKNKLILSIENYLKNNSLKIDNTVEKEELIRGILNIYDNETQFYMLLNNFKNTFNYIRKITIIVLSISILLLIICLVLTKPIKNNLLSSIIMSSGLILLFIKCNIYDKINYKDIKIISESFSRVVNNMLVSISNLFIIAAITLVISSIIILFIEIKRSSRNGRN